MTKQNKQHIHNLNRQTLRFHVDGPSQHAKPHIDFDLIQDRLFLDLSHSCTGTPNQWILYLSSSWTRTPIQFWIPAKRVFYLDCLVPRLLHDQFFIWRIRVLELPADHFCGVFVYSINWPINSPNSPECQNHLSAQIPSYVQCRLNCYSCTMVREM